MKRFIITSAQNTAKLHRSFWDSLNVAAHHLDAQIIVHASVYRNPSAYKQPDKGDDTYPVELIPYLSRKRVRLAKRLTAFLDVPVQATATTPLSGLEVLCSETSAIIGHAKRQIVTVSDGGTSPRVLWTTGSVTLPKYSKSKAGIKGREHHVLGALIVEVQSNGTFFVRNVTANKRTGEFTDLDVIYGPDAAYDAPRALAVVAGDLHLGLSNESKPAQAALRGLIECVRPKNVVLHDVLDFDVDSHHAQRIIDQQRQKHLSVEDSVNSACMGLAEIASWQPDASTWVVDSNHHGHLNRWLEDYDPGRNPRHFRFWVECWERRLRDLDVDPFEAAYRQYGCRGDSRVTFLKRGEPLAFAGIRCDWHSHVGPGGSRGSLLGFSKLGVKCIIAHSHTPGWRDGALQVGTNSKLDIDYAKGSPSSWLHADAVILADGFRQLIVKQGEQFRGR